FEPVPFENMLLVDGGLMDNLPITPLKQTFPQLKTVCVDILPAVFINKNLGTINNFLRSTFLIARKSMEDQKHMCDIYLEPPIQHISVIDYKKFDELYNFGYETAMSKIKTDF
ncbi:MAG: Patatin, partial [Candidatus Rehaiarchaeum fermentans]|nr:Patatin [Candidatus Rehaiarchaeum fermentans]